MSACAGYGHIEAWWIYFLSKDERTIGAGEFKAKCLKLLDEVSVTRKPIVITKHRKPVATVVPYILRVLFHLAA
jgi:prevent-host-death family protein